MYKINNKILIISLLMIIFLMFNAMGATALDCKYSAVGDVCGDLGAHCGNVGEPSCCPGMKCFYSMCMAEAGTSCSDSDDCNGPCENNVVDCQGYECCGRHAMPCQSDDQCCYEFYCSSSSNTCRTRGPVDSQCVCGVEYDFYDVYPGVIEPQPDGSCTNPSCGTAQNCEISCGTNLACFEDRPYCTVASYLLWPNSEVHKNLCYTFTADSTQQMICDIQVQTSCYGLSTGLQDQEKVDLIINGDSLGITVDPFCNAQAPPECRVSGPYTQNFNDVIIPVQTGTNSLTLLPVRDSVSIKYFHMSCEPYESCGDGVVGPDETCEPPYPVFGSYDNQYCSQSTENCDFDTNMLGVRDAFGDCDDVCGCDYDNFDYSCVEDRCGAECDADVDCGDYCAGDTRFFGGECDVNVDCSCGYSSENCNVYDNCYAYGDGCEDRDYTCEDSDDVECGYDYSNRNTDYYDLYQYYCSAQGELVKKHKKLHDFYCEQSTCSDHESWTNDQVVKDCDDDDGWYDTGNTKWVETDQCNEKEKKEQKYKDYYCDIVPGGVDCTYIVTETRWVATGNTRYKPDGTICNDGLYCSNPDVCTNGVCGGDDRDCSYNDFGKLEGCYYIPDDYDYTWDVSPGFKSVCDEEKDICTEGSRTWTHVCADNDMFDTVPFGSGCDAECDENVDCDPNTCSETYNDYCSGKKLVEYDSDKKKDSTTVSDSCDNSCDFDSCFCTDCCVDCSPPQTNEYCVKDVCGAGCAVDSDCDDGDQFSIDTCNVATCSCEYEYLPYCGNEEIDNGEECELPNTDDNVYCEHDITEQCASSGKKLGTRDAYGDCNAGCGCVDDPFTYKCVEDRCGAVCDSDDDCDDADIHTIDTCNLNTCGCEHDDIPYCGDGNLDPGEECEISDPYTGWGPEGYEYTCKVDNTYDKCVDCKYEHVDECKYYCSGDIECDGIPPMTDLLTCAFGYNYLQDYCNEYCELEDTNCEDDFFACTSDPECDELDPNTGDCNYMCQYKPLPVCGNDEIEAGEDCEMPNTFDNAFCEQTTVGECDGKKSNIRDGYGDCDSECGCIPDQFTPMCIELACGADCDSDDDCDDGNEFTTETCNFETCGCEYEDLPFCGNNVLDPGEECDGGTKPCIDQFGYAGLITCEDNCTWGECETYEYCGDEIINGGEACELPGTSNNTYCEQSTEGDCVGAKTKVRDAFGECGQVCNCIDDFFEPVCIIDSCGAECVVDSDCDDSDENTIDTCNSDSCGCEYQKINYCEDVNVYLDYAQLDSWCGGDSTDVTFEANYSDDIYAFQESCSGETPNYIYLDWYDIDFENITDITVILEHKEASVEAWLEYYNGSDWVVVCNLPQRGQDTFDSCEIDFVDTQKDIYLRLGISQTELCHEELDQAYLSVTVCEYPELPDSCVEDSECPYGFLCVDEECVLDDGDDDDNETDPECTLDADCNEGFVCTDNVCVDDGSGDGNETDGSCAEDSDCEEGYTCLDNECTELEDEETPVVTPVTSSGGGGGGGSFDDSKYWICDDWSPCINGEQTQECKHSYKSGTTKTNTQECEIEEESDNGGLSPVILNNKDEESGDGADDGDDSSGDDDGSMTDVTGFASRAVSGDGMPDLDKFYPLFIVLLAIVVALILLSLFGKKKSKKGKKKGK